MRLSIRFEEVERDGFVAQCIHVKIDAAIFMENEIANGICPLDGEGVVVPGIHEPGVLCCDEVTSQLVGPVLGLLGVGSQERVKVWD